MLNTTQLKNLGILEAIIPLHDFYGINEVKRRWEQTGPRFIPMPFPIIKQYYKEGINN